jgi:hypothetical protein
LHSATYANLAVCEIAHAPTMMRRAINAGNLQRFIDASAHRSPEEITEDFLSSLAPRPAFSLSDDLRLRRLHYKQEGSPLGDAPVQESCEAAKLAQRGDFDAMLTGAQGALIYCRIRLAFDFGLDFVRAVVAAENTWVKNPASLNSLDSLSVAHSPLLTAATLASRATITLPDDAASRLCVLQFCFHRDTLVDPIGPGAADKPVRIGALAFGVGP